MFVCCLPDLLCEGGFQVERGAGDVGRGGGAGVRGAVEAPGVRHLHLLAGANLEAGADLALFDNV